MVEEIEIKRKVFEVIETLGEHSKKVTRKNNIYYLKDYSYNVKEFEDIVDGNHKCAMNGLKVPKIYMFDKESHIIVEEFIEHKNVVSLLMEGDLPEAIYDQVFMMNYISKRYKFSIVFDPINFGFNGETLYYFGQKVHNFSEKYWLEKTKYFLWFYSKDFVQYLINKGLDLDSKRANQNQGYLNKQIALTVVKYYR